MQKITPLQIVEMVMIYQIIEHELYYYCLSDKCCCVINNKQNITITSKTFKIMK